MSASEMRNATPRCGAIGCRKDTGKRESARRQNAPKERPPGGGQSCSLLPSAEGAVPVSGLWPENRAEAPVDADLDGVDVRQAVVEAEGAARHHVAIGERRGRAAEEVFVAQRDEHVLGLDAPV